MREKEARLTCAMHLYRVKDFAVNLRSFIANLDHVTVMQTHCVVAMELSQR